MNVIELILSGELPSEWSWAPALVIALLIFWLWSIVAIAREKTEDPYDRIVWLLIVLALNFVGSFLCLFFGPRSNKRRDGGKLSEEEIKRRANDGTL